MRKTLRNGVGVVRNRGPVRSMGGVRAGVSGRGVVAGAEAVVSVLGAGGSEVRPAYEPADALTLYMREVGKTPLLRPEEEIELAALIRSGDEEARVRMIKANLRLVVKIAREYEHLGLPLLDLINEGNIGLMKAVQRFDPAKGGKFSTYSSWWIRQSVRRAVTNQAKTIRLPVHVVDKICRMSRTAGKLRELLGREASDEELADELAMSPKRVARLKAASVNTSSLDAPLGDDESQRLADVVEDEGALSPAQVLVEGFDLRRLGSLVARLGAREARIIRSRFGLEDGRERTLEDVGEELGVTRERIRQLQNEALSRLREMLEEPDAGVVAAESGTVAGWLGSALRVAA